MMKAVVLDGYLVNHDNMHWAVRDRFPDLVWYDESTPDQIAQRIGDAEIVFACRAPITAETFEKCPNIKYIGVLGTGFNAIDVAAASAHDVVVSNVSGYSTDAVTQVTFSLLLEIMGSISARTDYVKQWGWTKFKDPGVSAAPMFEIAGKTMGIIGMGSIGTAVARVANAFGMNVVAYRRHPDKSLENDRLKFVDLETLYAVSDVISIHCPLTPETQGMINAGSIAKMKDGVVILNTSRGPVINEQDLADALDSGKVYMAGLDVLTSEPPKPDCPLVGHPRCLISPHIGWTPKETRARLLDISAQCLFGFLEGKPMNVVNKK